MAFFKFTKFGSHVAIFATFFVGVLAGGSASRAANFEQQGDVIQMSGEIAPDDLSNVANFVAVKILERTTNPVSGHPWLKIDIGDGDVGFVDADT